MFPLTTKQIEGVRWLLQKRRAMLGDDVGCGKTRTVLTALTNLPESERKRVLIISKNTSLRDTWYGEIEKWTPQLLEKLHFFSRNTRKAVLKHLYANRKTWSILLCPTDMVRTFCEELKQWPWDVVVVDEFHNFGNIDAQRTQCLLEVIKETNPKHVYLLSANFLRNKATDIYPGLSCIDPNRFSKQAFRKWVTEYVGYEHLVLPTCTIERIRERPKDPEKFKLMLSEHLLARQRDASDYPAPQRPIILRPELHPDQRRVYDRMKNEWWAQLSDGDEFGAVNALARDRYLQQICISHHLLEDTHKCEGGKIDTLESIVESTTEQVFVCSTSAKAIHRLGFKHKDWAFFTGQSENPEVAIRAFRNGDCQVLMTTYWVGGESLNLQNATIFVALDYDWVPSTYHQAVGRLARTGQTVSVLPQLILARNTIDDYIYRVTKVKEEIIEVSMPPAELALAYAGELRLIEEANEKRSSTKLSDLVG